MSKGCDYQGPHFGAFYPDAGCIDGYLWDLDSCDEPGGPLYSGGDVPCPCCNTWEYISNVCPAPSGNARQRRVHRRVLARKVRSWAGVPATTQESAS